MPFELPSPAPVPFGPLPFDLFDASSGGVGFLRLGIGEFKGSAIRVAAISKTSIGFSIAVVLNLD